MKTVLAVDVMGGDHGPSVTVPAPSISSKATPKRSCCLLGGRRMFARRSAALLHLAFK